ncbi:MAG TPA: glycosyltransferase [Terriglobia bacterium]|nr:glycosyltransferase [Terriglobia bacterium]
MATPVSSRPSETAVLTETRRFGIERLPFFYWGAWSVSCGLFIYGLAIALSITRLLLIQRGLFVDSIARLLWISGFPTTVGVALIALDLALMLPAKRRLARRTLVDLEQPASITVTLTAYNDEESIGAAVRDFVAHPRVRRVIVVDNNSSDATAERAREAGAIVHVEPAPGYGSCVYRCLSEGVKFEDTNLVALCEGDMTFRAADLDKFLAYQPHAEIVNGTRIVEQLRHYDTQLSTFMYYGNFVVGKMLEVKHLGKGTFTDVGTTYKVIRRDCLPGLLRHMDPRVNLEFNAHFLDRALEHGYTMVECPITFHPRVGKSKGGNVNNLRALKVGMRMILGLSFGWRTPLFH